jgi:hypothetical protein
LRASGTTTTWSDGVGHGDHPDQVGIVTSPEADRRTGIENLGERGLIGTVVVVVPGHELHPGRAAA